MFKPLIFLLISVFCIADYFLTGVIISTPEEEINPILSTLFYQFGMEYILYFKVATLLTFLCFYNVLKFFMYFPVFLAYLFVVTYELWLLFLNW